jgi:hypothetical protein
MHTTLILRGETFQAVCTSCGWWSSPRRTTVQLAYADEIMHKRPPPDAWCIVCHAEPNFPHHETCPRKD